MRRKPDNPSARRLLLGDALDELTAAIRAPLHVATEMVDATRPDVTAAAAVDLGSRVSHAVERLASGGDGECGRATRHEAHLSLTVWTDGHEATVSSRCDSCLSWVEPH